MAAIGGGLRSTRHRPHCLSSGGLVLQPAIQASETTALLSAQYCGTVCAGSLREGLVTTETHLKDEWFFEQNGTRRVTSWQIHMDDISEFCRPTCLSRVHMNSLKHVCSAVLFGLTLASQLRAFSSATGSGTQPRTSGCSDAKLG